MTTLNSIVGQVCCGTNQSSVYMLPRACTPLECIDNRIRLTNFLMMRASLL